jgi:copper homeostasis protein CutC
VTGRDNRRITLEIAVSTPDEAVLAAAGGADRLELCSGLEVGGLTPSLGTFQLVREAVEIPVHVLLRPRPGGFCYSDRELDTMTRDAESFMAAGSAGLVFGILTSDGTIDRNRCKTLIAIAGGRAVFHRAFDFLPDPLVALHELIDLGFARVLTSGGAATAELGIPRLVELVQHADWKIEILPAGNIRPGNVARIVTETHCTQVHSSARSLVADSMLAKSPDLTAGIGADATGSRFTTDIHLVAAMRAELDRLTMLLSSSS